MYFFGLSQKETSPSTPRTVIYAPICSEIFSSSLDLYAVFGGQGKSLQDPHGILYLVRVFSGYCTESPLGTWEFKIIIYIFKFYRFKFIIIIIIYIIWLFTHVNHLLFILVLL